MKKILVLLLAFSLALCVSGSVYANLINGGFETGDFTGWTLSNSSLSSVVIDHIGDQGKDYDPVEGNYFARLAAGAQDVYTQASQTVSLLAGDILSGWVAFDAGDYLPFNDDAYVRVVGFSDIWFRDIATVGDYNDGDWENWSWTAPAAGQYTIEFGVINRVDSMLPSMILIDANQITPIPEPATMFLLGSGLAGLAGFRRKFRKS